MLTVLAAGIPRSGSTLLFNKIRLVLQCCSSKVYADWFEDFSERKISDYNVFKLHDPNNYWENKADVVITSHRDLRDIIASLLDRDWVTPDRILDAASKIRAMHDYWSPRARLDISYEKLTGRPRDSVREIGQAVGFDLTDRQIDEVIAAVPIKAQAIGPRGHDPVSLLHVEHITDGRPGRWRERLEHHVAEDIWAHHAEWLTKRGYAK